MADSKPGFFKRMFSFGRKVEEAPAPEVEQPPVEDILPSSSPSGLTRGSTSEVEMAEIEEPLVEPGEVDPRVEPEDDEIVESAEEASNEIEPETVAGNIPEPVPELELELELEPEPEPEPIAPSEPIVPAGISIRDAETVGVEETPEPEPEKKGWFARLTSGLSRSSNQLTSNISGIFTKRKLDDDTLQELEDTLIQADLGVETAMNVTEALAKDRFGKDVSTDEVRRIMATEVEKVLGPVAMPLELDLSHKPHVILVVGVNGTGKTTTIGKLAAKLRAGGLEVMLAAGDTFRAAAIEQLRIWGERVGAPVRASKLGADAAGLAFDAFEAAREAGSDVLIIDTAGRLQNKTELMDELAKIVRVLQKIDPEAPHTVLQTLDATTGQNALQQVEIFKQTAGVNGLVMTKLDGTARGGILVAIAAKHKLPVYFVGVGEGVDDLEPFDADQFAQALTGGETGGAEAPPAA